MNNKDNVTADEIYGLLLKKYEDGRQFACAGEVGDSTGWQMRRLDFVAVDCYASNGFKIHAFEIKISKADLKRELMEPEKHNIFFPNIDTYTIVAPYDVVDMDLIPKNWGVIVVKEHKLVTKRKPIALHDEYNKTMDRRFAICLMRAISHQSAQAKALTNKLHEEYQRGFKNGEERNQYLYREVQRKTEEQKWKLDFFDRIGVWSQDDVSFIIPVVEQLLKAHRKFLDAQYHIRTNIKNLEELKNLMESVSEKMNKLDTIGQNPSLSTENGEITTDIPPNSAKCGVIGMDLAENKEDDHV